MNMDKKGISFVEGYLETDWAYASDYWTALGKTDLERATALYNGDEEKAEQFLDYQRTTSEAIRSVLNGRDALEPLQANAIQIVAIHAHRAKTPEDFEQARKQYLEKLEHFAVRPYITWQITREEYDEYIDYVRKSTWTDANSYNEFCAYHDAFRLSVIERCGGEKAIMEAWRDSGGHRDVTIDDWPVYNVPPIKQA